jgi:uncharacterized protein (DUF302 family)
MNTSYAFTTELRLPMAPAVEALRAALAAEQMRILSVVDVQAMLKARPGADRHPQKLLGICSPTMVQALLEAEADIGALLPCGCGVSEPSPGRTRIALQDPRIIAAASRNLDVRAACELASATLRRVVDRLSAGSPPP